jgi:ubiquinone/menaquinone biosynthesis C-methylase UbiE
MENYTQIRQYFLMSFPASPCPFCDFPQSKSLYHFKDIYLNNWHLNRCESCNLFFLNPRPSLAQLQIAYEEAYFGKGEKKFAGIYEGMVQFFRRARARSLARALNGKGRVLDIGCGSGDFLGQLAQCGQFDLWGSETGSQAIKRASGKGGINLLQLDLSQSVDLPGTFDAITCYHVFEHVLQPRQLLENMTRMSHPGSLIEISFPNIRSLQAKLFKGKWLHLDPPRHLHHITPIHLIRELEERGFKLLKYSSLSIEQNPFGFCQSLLNVLLKDRDVLLERLKGNKAYCPRHGKLSISAQKAFCAVLLIPAILGDLLLSPFKLGATVKLRFLKLP